MSLRDLQESGRKIPPASASWDRFDSSWEIEKWRLKDSGGSVPKPKVPSLLQKTKPKKILVNTVYGEQHQKLLDDLARTCAQMIRSFRTKNKAVFYWLVGDAIRNFEETMRADLRPGFVPRQFLLEKLSERIKAISGRETRDELDRMPSSRILEEALEFRRKRTREQAEIEVPWAVHYEWLSVDDANAVATLAKLYQTGKIRKRREIRAAISEYKRIGILPAT
ncbi:MAG: hypothetical protein ACYCQJ_04920 [Nitrososphaerales archaeon]